MSVTCAPASAIPASWGTMGLKRSFADIVSASSPIHTDTNAAASGEKFPPPMLICYSIERNPSTASTPRDSPTSSSSRASSPYSFMNSESDDEDVTCNNNSLLIDVSESESQCDCGCEYGEIETGEIETEIEVAGDETDEEIEDGTGIPVDTDVFLDDEDEDSAAEFEDDSPSLDDVEVLTGDYSLKMSGGLSMVNYYDGSFERSYRHRHKSLSNFRVPSASRYDSRRPQESYRSIRYHQTPGSALRLQIASAAVCHSNRRSNNSNQSSSSYPTTQQERVPNPYQDASRRYKKEQHPSPARDSKYINKQPNKLARCTVRHTNRSLASANRPAIKHAKTAAHKVVLQDRAVRKVQLNQPRKAKKIPVAIQELNHVDRARRKSSKYFKQTAKPAYAYRRRRAAQQQQAATPPVIEENRVDKEYNPLTTGSSFDEFRYQFYFRHKQQIENAFNNNGYMRVTGVRMCPINSKSKMNFMSKLSSLSPTNNSEVPLVFHGTKIHNMQSICDRGLLVPNFSKNGVAVANGSAYGVGVYSSTEASYSCSYASATTSTIFVCAALTTGASNYGAAECIVAGTFVVLMQEARICPLFLLDFEQSSHSRSNYMYVREYDIRMEQARKMLHRIYAKLKKQFVESSRTHQRASQESHSTDV